MMHDIVNNNNAVNENDELFKRYKETKSVRVRNEIVGRYLYLSEILTKKFLNRAFL